MALKRRGDGSMVRAGDMTIEVYIKQPTLTEDGQGGRTGTPATVATVWANVIPLAASRALAYGMVMNNKPHEVDMRWEEDAYTLDEDTTLVEVVSGRILHVHSVIDVDRKAERAKLVCTEKK